MVTNTHYAIFIQDKSKSFNQELLSRFVCVGISITISKYQFVFTGEHVSSYEHTHVYRYI